MKEKILVLFDIDWTLLAGGLSEHIDGFSYAWKKVLGIDAHLDDWKDHHGQPDVVLLYKIPQLSHGIKEEILKAKIEELKAAKIEYFFAHARKTYRDLIMPGVLELLNKLKLMGIPMALKSGNLQKIGMYRIKSAGLADYFLTGGWGDNVDSKAESAIIAVNNCKKILKTDFSPDNVYDVGDSKYDIEGDIKAGIKSIAVATGFESREKLEKAGGSAVLESLKETDKFLSLIGRSS